MGGVIRRYADLNSIALYNLDPVFFHAAGKDAGNHHVIVTLNFHGSSAHDSRNKAFQFD
jgi:hypothetical protein